MSGNASAVTRVIVNADDFGFSDGITDGILKAASDGILTSTTIMATMPGFERAATLGRQHPGLGIGVHLCLTQGTPQTPLAALGGPGGRFPRTIPGLARRLSLVRGAIKDAEAEWSAQIQRVMDAGIRPTHLDSHKHVHHLPALHSVVIRLAQRYEIPAIRCARELALPGARPALAYRVLTILAQRLACQVAAAGMATTDWFFGLATTGRTDGATLLRLANAAPRGIGEVMVHPGFPDALAASDTRLLQERVLELESLCLPEVKAAFASPTLRCVTYGAMRSG